MSALDVELFTPSGGADPADLLSSHGPDRLAAALADPQRSTLLDLLIDQQLNHYDWSPDHRPLRDLPIASHAAHQATRVLAQTWRDRTATGPADIAQMHQQLTRIVERTGADVRELNGHLIDLITWADHDEFDIAEPITVAHDDIEEQADPRACIEEDIDLADSVVDDREASRARGIQA